MSLGPLNRKPFGFVVMEKAVENIENRFVNVGPVKIEGNSVWDQILHICRADLIV